MSKAQYANIMWICQQLDVITSKAHDVWVQYDALARTANQKEISRRFDNATLQLLTALRSLSYILKDIEKDSEE